jgi:protein dithiol:quinone oxidoreductase
MIARLIYLSVLLASALLLGLGMYYQYALHLHPCGAQVLVRYALVLTALFALVVVAINAGKAVRIAMSICIGLASVIGAVLSAHQSWPRHVRLDFAAAGVSLDSIARALPLADVLPRFFLASGACDKARWTLGTIAASEWAFAAFIAFIVAAFIAARRS